MIADEFRQAKQPDKVDLNSIRLTKFARELLSDLMESSDRRIYYTPQKEWGFKAKDEFSFGAKIVSITKVGTLENIKKTNVRQVRALFYAGIIKVDSEIKLHPRIVVFKLAIPLNDIRELRSKAILRHVDKVTKKNLTNLALVYGLKVEYHKVRRLFSVEPLDGNNDMPCSYIFESPEGHPVTGYNDMTMVEWDEVFFNKAKAFGIG
ncbi:hypothetical protein I6Y99_004372 [Vibrio parahaemolyticus]|nr:hypothetical protein [Vibrio parahaemolyticus]